MKDLEKLENFRIHELRDFARKMGVKSPTSQKKEDIIKEIVLIASGQKQPYINTSKQGRPPRINLDQKNNDQIFDAKQNQNSNQVNSTVKQFADNELIEFEGYVNIIDDKGYLISSSFLKTKKDVILSQIFLEDNNLYKGQLVKVKAYINQVTNLYYAIELLDKDNSTGDFDKQNYNELTQPIDQSGQYLFGGKYYFDNSNIVDKDNLVNNINNKITPLKVINYNITNTSNNKNVNINYNLQEEHKILTLDLVINNAKRLAEQGKNVVVVINNFIDILKSYNLIITQEFSVRNINKLAIENLKNLLSSAKQLENGSITLICVDSHNIPPVYQEFIDFELKSIFNN